MYQWKKGSDDIPDATSATLNYGPVTSGDNNATFSCVVLASGSGKSLTTRLAKLTVSSDTTPPKVVKVVGSDTFTVATLTFDEGMAEAIADASLYTSSGGLTIASASLSSSNRPSIANAKRAAPKIGPRVIRSYPRKTDTPAWPKETE